jgi:hypothetical protein
MLLTITTIHTLATDLGYLLIKNPARAQTFDLAFGQAHVFYSEATAERYTAALVLGVDPVGFTSLRIAAIVGRLRDWTISALRSCAGD